MVAAHQPPAEYPYQQPGPGDFNQPYVPGRHAVLTGVLAPDGTINLDQAGQTGQIAVSAGGRHRSTAGAEAWNAWRAQDPDYHAGLAGRTYTLESGQVRGRHAVEPLADGQIPEPMTAAEFLAPARNSGDVLTQTEIARQLLQTPGFIDMPGAVRDRVVDSALRPHRLVTDEDITANALALERQRREATVGALAAQFAFRPYRGGSGVGASVMADYSPDQLANRAAAAAGTARLPSDLPRRRQ